MTTLRSPEPILVADLFEPLMRSLLDLLETLTPEEWATPDACGTWSVHEVGLHLLGADVGILSRQRDAYQLPGPSIAGWDDLVVFINTLNDQWVTATRRLSPRLLHALLGFTGAEVAAYFLSVDPHRLGGAVSWAGPGPATVWLDVAREYTERWHHQQQIRDAVGRPGLYEPHLFAPVLDAFVRALPYTFRDVHAPGGTTVALLLDGSAGGTWVLEREADGWVLSVGRMPSPTATVRLPQEVAWRLFTKGMTAHEALPYAQIEGDDALGRQVLRMVSVIA